MDDFVFCVGKMSFILGRMWEYVEEYTVTFLLSALLPHHHNFDCLLHSELQLIFYYPTKLDGTLFVHTYMYFWRCSCLHAVYTEMVTAYTPEGPNVGRWSQ